MWMIPVHLSFLPMIIFHQEMTRALMTMMNLRVLLDRRHPNPMKLQGKDQVVKGHNDALSEIGKEPEKKGTYTLLAPLQTPTDVNVSGDTAQRLFLIQDSRATLL